MFIRKKKKNIGMSKEESEELSEPVLEPRDQVDRLINQGELEKAIEIIEGREKEEGIEELRWRIVESRYRNEKAEYQQVIEITEGIIKEIEELEDPVEEKEEQIRKRIRIDALNEQGGALNVLSRLEKGMEKVEEGIRLIEELEGLEGEKDKERKVNLLVNKGDNYNQKGKMDQALECYEKSLAISKDLGNKRLIAHSLNGIGDIYFRQRGLDQALEFYEKSWVIREELGNKRLIAESLNSIGLAYSHKGELDQALEFFEKSRVISEELGNKRPITLLLNNIGYIYHQKGELGQALDIFKEGLVLSEEERYTSQTAHSLWGLGIVYQELGELEEALDAHKQCFVMLEEIGNKLGIAYILFHLVDVAIDLEDIEQAREYLSELQLINEQEEDMLVDLQCRLAEALILKTSKRRKSLTKAQEILNEIVEEGKEEIILGEYTVKAIINLSELLLKELQSTGEEEILEEVEETVDKLLEIAKKQQSYTFLTESYWLKAQLALVKLDLNEARNLLSQAQKIAEERGLERLARKISSEHDQLLNQLDQWEELIAKDASITERVKVANLEELMGWMTRKREIMVDEPEDEPIMLLLVAESGLPIYSKQFNPTKELQDMLISGFLSSINSFVKEAFHVTGMIRRITHDEYTLSFNLIESILFCYVYEGQSYTAMKKLEKLMTEVHESEVWSALEEVGRKGYGLTRTHKDQMEGVIADIFLTN